MSGLVETSIEGRVATLTLNRPERHNALIPELLSELIERVLNVSARPGVRSIVLAANGRSFSTGGDVAGFAAHMDDLAGYASEIVGLLNEVMLTIMRIDEPVVAAVHGAVTGGSLGLVLAADLVVAAPEASFTPWYSVVGFAPDGGWSAILPARIGRSRAANVLLRNVTITAEQGLRWGLIDEIAQDVRGRALAIAADLAGMKTTAVKRSLNAVIESVEEALEQERSAFIRQVVTEESRTGIEAFLNRQHL